MVLYRLFVLAWALKHVHSVGLGNNAMGRVSCINDKCLPCRRFVSDFIWTMNMTKEDCNCTQQLNNFDPYVRAHTVKSYNESSGQCYRVPGAATEFDLLMTGFEDRNIPFHAENAVMRPARVYVKAVAACSSRKYTDYTQGVVRVHEHFGIRLLPPFVYVMYNGSWELSKAHMRGTFFINDDEMVQSPFHEIIFDLRIDSTAIYYNTIRLVNTSLHAHQMFGGIQLDGASGPWMNWLAVYDDQCDVNCYRWECDEKDCFCVDVLATPAPVVEVEDAGLLIVILFVMLTNIGCLILFTVFWRCYGKTQRVNSKTKKQEAEGRRSKRNSSMYSGRGSAYGRRSTMQPRPSVSTRTESQEHSAFGRSLSDNIRASRPGALSRASQDSIRLTSREGENEKEDLKPPKPSGKPKPPKPTKNAQPKKPKPKKKTCPKQTKKNRSKSKKDNKKKKGVTEMTKANAAKDNRTKKKPKQANSPASQERVKTEAKASADAVSAVELNHQNVEQNVAERTTRNSKLDKNPSKESVGLVHAINKRKDSEPKAEAQSFSLQRPNPNSFLPVKISFARSSSSSDNMGKEETPVSKTISPERSEIERERVIEPRAVQAEELQTEPALILYE